MVPKWSGLVGSERGSLTERSEEAAPGVPGGAGSAEPEIASGGRSRSGARKRGPAWVVGGGLAGVVMKA